MVTERKREWVRELEEAINRSPNLVFTDFRGLTVDNMERLRRELYERNSRLQVVKNTLALRAFEQALGDREEEEAGTADEAGPPREQQEEAPELADLPGVGPSKVESLEEQGFDTVASVRDAAPEELQKTAGIGETTASKLIAAAADLLPDAASEDPSDKRDSESDEPLPSELRSVFEGNTAVAFSGNGFVSMAEILVEFAEEHEDLRLKGGLMNGDFLPPETVEEISELPTRKELLASFAVGLNEPIQRLVRGLADPLNKLVSALNSVKQQKENE